MTNLNHSIRFFLLLAVAFIWQATPLWAQLDDIPVTLIWDSEPSVHQTAGQEFKTWYFQGAEYRHEHRALPYFSTRVLLPDWGTVQAGFKDVTSEWFDPKGVVMDIHNTKPGLEVTYEQDRNQYFARISVFPISVSGSSYERLTKFTLKLSFAPGLPPVHFRGTHTKLSKLNDGNLYKFSITQNGIHKIDKNFLQKLGVDVATINPQNIHILGNGGYRLPELIATNRVDDLAENAIFISGQDDGKFDDNDFILFHAVSTKPITKLNNKAYQIPNNPYSNQAFYYIKIDDKPGIRIQNQASLSDAGFETEDYIDCQKYELDKYNLLDEEPSSEGGGLEWFGEIFKAETTQSFNDKFDFPDIIKDKKANLRVRFAGRAINPVSFSVSVEDENLNTSIPGLGTDAWADVGRIRTYDIPFFPKGTKPNITLTYQANSIEAKGWLDYIEMNAHRRLIYKNQPFTFGSLSDTPHPVTTFRIIGQDLQVWDITAPYQPKNQALTQDGDIVKFTVTTDTLKRFAVFKMGDNFPTPEAIGSIPNQNIHGIEKADLILLYHPSLKNEALKLAAHRATHDQMNVVTVNVEDVYNEFSSGIQDPTGIRDFVKMVYDRDPDFKYLLLFGDGSYDAKNIKNNPSNYNLIPVRETQNSVQKINTYPSDDFYGLLSDSEGDANLNGALDIAVGRITARTPDEAAGIVDKIIFYDTDPSTLKPWRTRLVSIGDDGDGAGHMSQANELADLTDGQHQIFNTKKVFLDAYPQVPAPYGQRVPEATKQINDAVLSGTLIVNYFGHGGANGLAQERVLTRQSIQKWKHIKAHLPLIITASCSTAGFDDPAIKTFGEDLLKNPTGGAIALFSTVRPVYSQDNKALIFATFPQIFIRDNGQARTIGEMLRIGKNNAGSANKVRKFLLLGDPSMQLALPQDNIVLTDKINGTSLQAVDSVAIEALTKVTIDGHLANHQGQKLTDFNGKVYITIYDQYANFLTLGQDNPPLPYKARKGIIFKGLASVTAGDFQFSFVVPKDVVSHGYGKISYYATDEISRDAAGYEEKLYINGSTDLAIKDDTPPVVELFMNDEEFVSGGLTNDHPTIFAKLSDDNGINISGSGVGHDLTATIDGEIHVANNYYEASANDYTKGEMHYPLEDIAPGEHTIAVKAWDVANNSGEAEITFFVAETDGAALAHVLNYPNPFTTHTSFQFEHNLSEPGKARIDIFSVDGKIIKTIDADIFPKGSRVTNIQWDGKDEYGDQLAKGVYIYRIKLTSLEGKEQTTTSGFEKLIIMK